MGRAPTRFYRRSGRGVVADVVCSGEAEWGGSQCGEATKSESEWGFMSMGFCHGVEMDEKA